MKIFAAMYNQMVEESCYGIISLHKTRMGAEIAMEYHKNERSKEYYNHLNNCDEEMKRFYELNSSFGKFEAWSVSEFDLKE